MSDTSLREVFSVFERYKSASGAKLNVRKSHGLLVGSWTSRCCHDIGQLPGLQLWALYFRASKKMLDSCLSSLDSIFSTWKERALSFHGRTMVANTLGLTVFWYVSSFLCMPDTVVADINK